VASINDEAFQVLRRGVQQTVEGNDPISIVVTGEPGSGKTHLLSRLRTYLEAATKSEDRPWYVYMACYASARTLWSHLRRWLIIDLIKSGGAGRSRLAELVHKDGNRLNRVGHLGVHRALESLASGRHTLTATAWLRGDPLTDADVVALGIGVEKEDEDRSRETEAKHVVEALLRFISPVPVVICFDQVEALETYPGEEAGYHALGQMVAALVNGEHRQLLLISCIVAAFEHNLDRIPNGADRDKWLQEKATLKRIEWPPARELVKTRLDSAPALRELRARHANAALWPLDENRLQELFAETGRCLPRALIQFCKTEFSRQMSDDLQRPPVGRDDFLQEEYSRLLAEARKNWRKEGGEKILEDSLPWLLQHSGAQVLRDAPSSHYANLTFHDSEGVSSLMFCYVPGNPFTSRLRKAEQDWKGKPDLKILSDPSIQPRMGSKGAQYLDQLKRRGAQQIHPMPEAVAALRAIQNLTANARAGELTLNGKNLPENEVTKWALENLPPQLESLRDELVAQTVEDPVKGKLLALLNQHKLMKAEAAGRELSLSVEEVASCVRRHPMHFGLLEGPPVVLFEAVEGPEEYAAHA
jgi:hypothetical protein